MEPKLPMPSPSPEMGGYQRREVQPVTPEQAPQTHVEAQPGGNAEREPRVEVQSQAPVDPATLPALPSHLYAPSATPQPATDTSSIASGNPTVASDNDLIEKEWVDKAKKIVQQTRDNPYEQEKEVSKLQADYIKKRYGKDVKLSNE
jgi:hypothetical protein